MSPASCHSAKLGGEIGAGPGRGCGQRGLSTDLKSEVVLRAAISHGGEMHRPVDPPDHPVIFGTEAQFGLTPDQLRGPGWSRPCRQLYLPPGYAADLRSLCTAYQLILPTGGVFTHLTAAALRGWWLPYAVSEIPLIVSNSADTNHLVRQGVYQRRCQLKPTDRDEFDGIRLAAPCRIIIECSEELCFLDLTVLIDSALHSGAMTLMELARAVIPRRRGVRTLRRAILAADLRSESPWETILRLLHELCGIPVVSQYVLNNDRGRFVARGDLRILGTNRLAEYDGAGHRERTQHQDDLRREKGVARIGWDRYGYTASEIYQHPEMIIHDAEMARGLTHNPARLKLWREEFARSALSDGGAAALFHRLRRFTAA